MSRDYGTYPRFGLRKRARAYQRRSGCGPIILAIIVLFTVSFLWLTRGKAPMETFIPRNPGYQIYTTDVLETAQRVAGSKVWDVIPEDRPEYDLRYRLAGGLPLPEWMIRNLFFGLFHVSGNDLENFSDPVMVTRITRVGNLLERLQILSSSIQGDSAGGLNLRHIAAANLYYAVRGRVLLMSPSRDALIKSLTLHAEDAAPAELLSAMESTLTNADIALELNSAPLKTAGIFANLQGYCEQLKLRVRVEHEVLQCGIEAALASDAEAIVHPVLGNLSPQPLKRPPTSMLNLSWNLGASPTTLWTRINSTLEEPINLSNMVGSSEEEVAESSEASVAEVLAGIAGLLGNSGRLMLRSVDQNEMIPAPELVGLFEADITNIKALMTSLPPWLEGDGELTYTPFYDAETGTVRMPLAGGPSMELTAAVYGGEALLATSRPAALALMQETPVQEDLSQPGNLYLSVKPGPLATEFIAAGVQFAEAGLLRDQTVASFQESAGYWQAIAQKLDTIAALAGYENGKITLDLRASVPAGQ